MRLLLAWGMWAGAALQSAVIGLAPVLFPAIGAGLPPEESLALAIFAAAVATVVFSFATAGLLIVRGAASHAVGWIMLAGGPTVGAVFVGYVLGVALLEQDSSAAGWLVLLGTVLFGPALFLIGPLLAALFPDGRYLSGRWRNIFRGLGAAVALAAIVTVVAPGPLEEGMTLRNPAAMPWLPDVVKPAASALSAAALCVGGIVGIAALVVRYRRGPSDVRHQLKWFIFAVLVWVAVLPFSFVVEGNVLATVAFIGLAFVPVAVLVAVFRYRLYEIDILINRTLVYVPLVGIVAGLYAGSVALLQRLFVSATGDSSDTAGVISAVVLAALFTPIRNAIQSVVDRRFKPEGPAVPDPAWSTPEFEAAVERIAARVLDRTRSTATGRPSTRQGG